MRFLGSSSWLVKFHALFGAGILATYLWTALSGWEPARAERGFIPSSVRSSPGGFRSYHYVHGGFRGGK
jgi:hypothetical protein